MYIGIKCVISLALIILWLRECRNDLVQALGNSFFILFVTILTYDIFALNQERIIIKDSPFNLLHLILDRILLLPLSLFIFLRIHRRLLVKVLLSIVWIFAVAFLETTNERLQVVELKKWTLINWGYVGGIVIVACLVFEHWFYKLIRSKINNASSS